MEIYEGKIYYKLSFSYPGYGRGVNEELRAQGYKSDISLRIWKLLSFRGHTLFLGKRCIVKGVSDELKKEIQAAAERYYGTDQVKVVFDSTTRYMITDLRNGQSKVFYEETYKFFKNLSPITFTDNWQVLYSEKTGKFYGYSHRGATGFGIGDMLFADSEQITDKVVESVFCKEHKYRKKFIKRLKYYDKKGDHFGFFDLMRGGIMSIVPFRDKGMKRIETKEEAFTAASRFASYVS